MQTLRDRPAVAGLERERLQDQEVECALREIDLFVGHRLTLCASTGA